MKINRKMYLWVNFDDINETNNASASFCGRKI